VENEWHNSPNDALRVDSIPLPAAEPSAKKGERPQPSIVYSGPKDSILMNRKTSESAVDRLIALANEKPAEPADTNSHGPTNLEAVPVFGEAAQVHDLERSPMWQSLLQFRVLLPYVSRLLEMTQTEPGPALSAELKQSVGELVSTQRELKMAVQDQMVQLKHLEEEMTRAKELNERSVTENLEVVEDMRSVQSAVKKAAFSVGALLLVMIGLTIWMLVREFHAH
jgi:hypothetical protein